MANRLKRFTNRSLRYVYHPHPHQSEFDINKSSNVLKQDDLLLNGSELDSSTYMPKRRRPNRILSSGFNTENYSAALRPLREKYKLNPLERMFLEAAERGDKSTVIRCLSFLNGLNVNCVNMLGRTAIQIAVDNENTELVELLLEQPGIKIGDALLYAIQEGVYKIVEMLINHPSITKEMLGSSWNSSQRCDFEESHDFSSDISPVILAAICNQFEILQLLINCGAQINEPHRSLCTCEQCDALHKDDPLKHALKRIITYRALASPAWISLTSPDPILTAFQLSSELLNLASRENEFKEIFISLCEQCRKYACDLLDLCRGTAEVVAVLNKSNDSDESESDYSTDDSCEPTTTNKLATNQTNLTVTTSANYSNNQLCTLSPPMPFYHQYPNNRYQQHFYYHNNHHHSNHFRDFEQYLLTPKCSNLDQSTEIIDNDWREMLDRSHGTKRKHYYWHSNWNKIKSNQCVSMESQHTILEDSGDDNLCANDSHSANQLNTQVTSIACHLNPGAKIDNKTEGCSNLAPHKMTPNYCKNRSNKKLEKGDLMTIPFIGTSESQNSSFYEPKQNSFNSELDKNKVQPGKHMLTTFKHNKKTKVDYSKKLAVCCYEKQNRIKQPVDILTNNDRDDDNDNDNGGGDDDDNDNNDNEYRNANSDFGQNLDYNKQKLKQTNNQRTCYLFKLDRLKLAIKHEQKRFVAHPHCQHLLTTLWYDQLPSWRKRHPMTKLFFGICFFIALPILAPIYLIYPQGRVGQIMRSPLIKFINHSASFAIFIFLLLIASTDTSTQTDLKIRSQIRGPDPNKIELLILWWVIGLVWSEMKQIWEEGFKAYVRQWWNWLDFLMLGLYLTTVALRIVAFILRKTDQYGNEPLPRNEWPATDPTLLSEALFSIAHIFSFARIIFLFQINEHLGPLQISLGNMLIDITKFIFIFLLVISSFACGLHQLYYYYLTGDGDGRPLAFTSLIRSYRTLFWHLFGSNQAGNFEILVENRTTGKRERMESAANTMIVGEILLLIYHGMAIIVLVNMLIAMMSNSFQKIQNHADTEWKFARSTLWVCYFDEGSTLPPPLNTILSPKSIMRVSYAVYYLIQISCNMLCTQCKSLLSGQFGQHQTTLIARSNKQITCPDNLEACSVQINKRAQNQTENVDIQMLDNQKTYNVSQGSICSAYNQHPNSGSRRNRRKTYYQTVMRRLVRRYIHQSKKSMRQDGVNEDDLLEIKQDISSLRFELREDRKREAARSIGQLEGLKQDIIKQMTKHSQFVKHPHPNQSDDEDHQPNGTKTKSNQYDFEAKSNSDNPQLDDVDNEEENEYVDNYDDQVSPFKKMTSKRAQSEAGLAKSFSLNRVPKKTSTYSYGKETEHMYDEIKQLALMNTLYEKPFNDAKKLVTCDMLGTFKQDLIQAIRNELHQNTDYQFKKNYSTVSTYASHLVSNRPLLKTIRTEIQSDATIRSPPAYLTALHLSPTSSSSISTSSPPSSLCSSKLKTNQHHSPKSSPNETAHLVRPVMIPQASTSKQCITTESPRRPQWANLGNRSQMTPSKTTRLSKPFMRQLQQSHSPDLPTRVVQTIRTHKSVENDPIPMTYIRSSFDETKLKHDGKK